MRVWSGGIAAILVLVSVILAQPVKASSSAFATAPKDDRAVTVSGSGDGRADDSGAIQRAIDTAARGSGGIVFLPSGRYRISRTIFVWPGVRVFGVGMTRPVIVLGDRTPGFQRGLSTMIFFAGAKRNENGRTPFPALGIVPFDPTIEDANPGTFYSAMSNIDIAIGAGNPAAVAIRFRAAQHVYLSHMDFALGAALAGLYQVGNMGRDLRFSGGRYGILTEQPSADWQFTLIDSTFEGQREAAIREHEAGLTLVNVAFRNLPTAIDVDRGHGDWLWGKAVRFENVTRAGVMISNETSSYTQIGFEDAVATNTPAFARFRDSGRVVSGPAATYRVAAFTSGLTVPALGTMGRIATSMKANAIAAFPAAPAPAMRPLPATRDWTNVRDLGAKGDGKTDDTRAIQHAIDSARVLYFPTGRYVVTDTLRLRPDTVLVALHPNLTQIVLPDGTPGYQGTGAAKALVEAPPGGDNIVSGLGLYTGGINPRATALLWMAGGRSLVEDVKFHGGHGSDLDEGVRFNPYNANHSGDADPAKRWDAQYPSLWVTRGGGGTFANIWSPNTYARAGFYVSDTSTPGHVYQLSVEHHVRNEIVLDRVANWEFLAPQTEEEAGESQDTTAIELRDSRDILIANYHAYRVTRSIKPALAAIRLYGSRDIRFRNVHVNAESGVATCDGNGCATFLRASKYSYENAILDVTSGAEMREREFALLDVTSLPPPIEGAAPTIGARVRKLADGFYSSGGGAVDANGALYFVDRGQQRIYRWSDTKLAVVLDQALDAVSLAVDRSGSLLVLSSDGRDGTVYSYTPGTPAALTVIKPTPAADRGPAATLVPVNYWVNGEGRDQLDLNGYLFTPLAEMFARDVAQPKPLEFVSPDGSLALPAYRAFAQGPADFRGWRFSHSLDAFGWTAARLGQRVYVVNDSEHRTYSALLGSRGTLTDLVPLAPRGGESVAADAQGRVFVADGQIFVYDPNGRELGRIDVPARPLQLIFGGANGRTLYILTHHALYAIET